MALNTQPMPAGRRVHRVTLQNPGPFSADADGNPIATWTDLSPAAWQVSIEPATERSLERITAGTVLAQASHIVSGPYRYDITTQTRVLFNGRILNVIGVSNPDERNIETIALCSEIVS